MFTPSERRVVAALRATVLVVLEGAVPAYACWGWSGPSDGRVAIEGRERTRRDVIGGFLEGDPWSSDRGTFGRSTEWRFEGGSDVRYSPETSTKGRRSIGMQTDV